ELPAPLLDDNYKKELNEDIGNQKTPESNIKMKIAWRYHSLTHGYKKLLQFIQNIIYEEGFDGSSHKKKQKNILRIGVQSLGSPLWGDDICCTENCDSSHSLMKFLYVLRGLLRTSLSACIITMPTHLIQ
ncbi:Elongator complex protein 4, partial [Galemys pyrenaicus]